LKAFAYPLLSNSLLQLPRVGGITGAEIGIDDLGDGFSLPVGKRELMSQKSRRLRRELSKLSCAAGCQASGQRAKKVLMIMIAVGQNSTDKTQRTLFIN